MTSPQVVWFGLVCGALSFAVPQGQKGIRTVAVARNIHMLVGSGGNVGISVGEDGVFMIDDKFAPLADQIKAAIKKLSPKPLRFLLNTHWHGDHTGGNERFGKTGAIIVAHENVRKRMSVDSVIEALHRKVPASPKAALPVVTFTSDVTFHWNGDTIHAFHVPPAHTDGDVVVHFKKANVIHTGDVYFNGLYPFIDLSSGGSVLGVIRAASRVIDLCDDKTKVIPGHGPLSDRAELIVYRDMLAAVRQRIVKLIEAGKSADEAVAAHPTKDFDAKWGQGFLKPDIWTRIVYQSVLSSGTARRKK